VSFNPNQWFPVEYSDTLLDAELLSRLVNFAQVIDATQEDATQEAVQREGNMTAVSRCCDDPKGMRLSAKKCESTVAA
jgi:hypothetical protein